MSNAWVDVRADALKRHARFRRDGTKPAMCVPPAKVVKEREQLGLPRLKPKVIFDTVADAEAFAAVVESLGDGPSRIYECKFSRHGHVHLTSGHGVIS